MHEAAVHPLVLGPCWGHWCNGFRGSGQAPQKSPVQAHRHQHARLDTTGKPKRKLTALFAGLIINTFGDICVDASLHSQAVLNTLSIGASLLLPPLRERTELLLSLLPQGPQSLNVLSKGQVCSAPCCRFTNHLNYHNYVLCVARQ